MKFHAYSHVPWRTVLIAITLIVGQKVKISTGTILSDQIPTKLVALPSALGAA